MAKKKSKRINHRAAPRAARPAAAMPAAPAPAEASALDVGQRVRVVHPASWAHNYEGAIRGAADGGGYVVQLDVKAVTHVFPAGRLLAL